MKKNEDNVYSTPFYDWLNDHEKEFLEVRLTGIGYAEAIEVMKKRFENEAHR
jgi:hypothetical protein